MFHRERSFEEGINLYRIIVSGCEAEVEVKKSRFIAAIQNCRSEEEARVFIESIRKIHYDARHHCFAMRIGVGGKPYERQSDDGEPQGTAGKPMLDILSGAGLTDVCAVVTRYFGGTLLGTGGLVRAYSDALKEALLQAEPKELSEGVRLSVSCGYAAANQVKNLARRQGIFSEKEEYAETCRLYYLLPEEKTEAFSAAVRELSSGRAETEVLKKVLYYSAEVPKVYKTME